MSTILDQSFQLAKETTYGTAVTLTRAYEVQADGWKRQQEDIPSVGMRPALQAQASDRVKSIIMGATGSTEFPVLNKGFGLIGQALFGSSTGPAQQSSTIAYKSTFATTTAGPAVYYTAQFQRVDSSGTLRSFTYPGSTVAKWKLSQKVGELLMLQADWDSRTEVTNVAAGSAVTPATATNFDWTQLQVTINGTEACCSEVEITGDLGLKVDRRLMCTTSAGLKRAPVRAAVPAFGGTITTEFEDLTNYALFTAGTIVPIVFTWTGANIVSSFYYTVKITLPNCKFVGDTPEASISDLTMQPLPFEALWDGTTAVATLEYTSTDTAL